eukprot:g1997.t1
MVKIIVAPGNGGCGENTLQANWYGWFHEEMLKRGHDSVCPNWPDALLCRESQWVPYAVETLGVDENTIVVGHSTGALLAMRLAEKHKLLGIILVSAAHTDLGMMVKGHLSILTNPGILSCKRKMFSGFTNFIPLTTI